MNFPYIKEVIFYSKEVNRQQNVTLLMTLDYVSNFSNYKKMSERDVFINVLTF